MTARGLVVVWAFIAVASTACLVIDDDTASSQAACARACDCIAPVPSQQADCVAECEEFAPQLAPACLDCLAGLDCPDLSRGGCADACQLDQATPFVPSPTTSPSSTSHPTDFVPQEIP